MDNPSSFFQHFLTKPDVIAALAGVLATLGAVLSTFQSFIALRRKSRAITISNVAIGELLESGSPAVARSPSQVARERVVARLEEAATSRQELQSASKSSKRTANLLAIGQYIVGGVLASSFIQESLTPKLVGGLGVLVLVASLFRQHFHPEIISEDARKRASQLQALIRTSEDRLSILDAKTATGQDHSDAMISLMEQLTQRLTEIESHEAVAPTRNP